MVAVNPVEEAVVREVWPVTKNDPPTSVLPETVRLVAEAFPSVEVPEVSVEKIPVVKVGLGVTEMVLVEENTMLDPAIKFDTGEL